jgi:hypothetical protein
MLIKKAYSDNKEASKKPDTAVDEHFPIENIDFQGRIHKIKQD